MRRLLAAALVWLAAIILPTHLRDWSRAMIAELAAIERPGAALAFASGCLIAALRQGFAGWPVANGRSLAILCAAGAVGLGFAYLAAAGAPSSYLLLNGAAFAIGLLAIGILRDAGRIWRLAGGGITLALAGMILLTGLLGASANGVTRWVAVGGVMLQPALILVPVVALAFARAPEGLSLLAVLVVATGLALQPDRAMAGALATAMAVMACFRSGRIVWIATVGALTAFAATVVRPDASPAMPFVDQILFSSFGVHPLAGLAVLAGAGLMLVPSIVGAIRDAEHRPLHLAFGAVWLCVILAAALGNHPTPLVGYGGSAILGYLLSLLALPAGTRLRIAVPSEPRNEPDEAGNRPGLRASLTAG